MAKVDGTVELPYITVDEPPGTYGHQGQNPEMPTPSVPHWGPGENPPGTDPPIPPTSDPALSVRAGTHPSVQTPPDREPGETDAEYEPRARAFLHQGEPPTRAPGDFEGDRLVGKPMPAAEVNRESDYPTPREPRIESEECADERTGRADDAEADAMGLNPVPPSDAPPPKDEWKY